MLRCRHRSQQQDADAGTGRAAADSHGLGGHRPAERHLRSSAPVRTPFPLTHHQTTMLCFTCLVARLRWLAGLSVATLQSNRRTFSCPRLPQTMSCLRFGVGRPPHCDPVYSMSMCVSWLLAGGRESCRVRSERYSYTTALRTGRRPRRQWSPSASTQTTRALPELIVMSLVSLL